MQPFLINLKSGISFIHKILLDVIGNDFVNYNDIWSTLEQREGTIVFQEYYLESELN